MIQLMDAFGWALVYSLWQGTVVGLSMVVVLAFLRRAEHRYRAACAALASLPFLFIWSFAGHYSAVTMRPVGKFMSAGEGQSLGILDAETFFLVGLYLEPFLPVVVASWFVGVLICSVLLTGGALRLRSLRRNAEAVSPGWQARFRDLARKLGVGDGVALLESPFVNVPTVIGLFKPLVLVPTSVMTSLTPAQLEAILLHELVHICRHDPLVNALQVVVETLFFYHPAVWWMSGVVRREREYCCDDAVVKLTGNVLLYAKALNELEDLRVLSPKLVLAASGGPFMNRIRRLVSPQTFTSKPLSLIFLSLLVTGLLAACAAGAVERNATSNTAPPATMICSFKGSIKTGDHTIPFFGEASEKAMAKVMLDSLGSPQPCKDAADALSVAYNMEFDARTLKWQADMTVTDAAGNILYNGFESDSIEEDGAFQYTTEHTAQILLKRFLEARARSN